MTEHIATIDKVLTEESYADLPEDDGQPMDSPWQFSQTSLLIESIHLHWRGRTDYYVGGNMFLYYSLQQVQNKEFLGPDFFLVKGVDGTIYRGKWVVWAENARTPDMIIELLSPSTKDVDLGSKKAIYEQKLHTRDYFCYDPEEQSLMGWRLKELDAPYVPLAADKRGWLWSEELGLWLGVRQGTFHRITADYVRFFTRDGAMVLTNEELLDAERQRADDEKRRADEALAEVARLRQELDRPRGR